MMGVVLVSITLACLLLLVDFKRSPRAMLLATIPALVGLAVMVGLGYVSPGLALLELLVWGVSAAALWVGPVHWVRWVIPLLAVLQVSVVLGIIPGAQRVPLYESISANWIKGMAAVSLVHLGGGWRFGLLATVAGVVYGISYHLTGKLSGAVLAHIGVNVGHFVFLQYDL